mmetsp:Transcript_15819/g.42659  ORF Transcript_15819/g.42659 Transcript_15819/m.42659 type:complete len:229 (-) Transcript_15819:137-823(-)
MHGVLCRAHDCAVGEPAPLHVAALGAHEEVAAAHESEGGLRGSVAVRHAELAHREPRPRLLREDRHEVALAFQGHGGMQAGHPASTGQDRDRCCIESRALGQRQGAGQAMVRGGAASPGAGRSGSRARASNEVARPSDQEEPIVSSCMRAPGRANEGRHVCDAREPEGLCQSLTPLPKCCCSAKAPRSQCCHAASGPASHQAGFEERRPRDWVAHSRECCTFGKVRDR